MLQIGDFVNYVLSENFRQPGKIRPAIVVEVWSDDVANLLVFTDGDNDSGQGNDWRIPYWMTSVSHDEDGSPGTWHHRQS